ncbi:hypothetical protein CRG98_000992 [Punica granatum]|uniref:Uncharacterized protein n=1 Tax=Punica granatum TaxID=22663 RepID=A0A2I0LD58_PUNGR|nr:hypothetical protein CRG98_000992 [Punica granatum]
METSELEEPSTATKVGNLWQPVTEMTSFANLSCKARAFHCSSHQRCTGARSRTNSLFAENSVHKSVLIGEICKIKSVNGQFPTEENKEISSISADAHNAQKEEGIDAGRMRG